MEDTQKRRLEIIKTCLNRMEEYSQCTALIAEAQLQLDKLLSADAPTGASAEVVLPISPDEVIEAVEGRLRSFPTGLLVWLNNEIVDNYEPADRSSHIETGRAPAYRGHNLLSCRTLNALFHPFGWNVQQAEAGIFVFSKRDEKQASSIN